MTEIIEVIALEVLHLRPFSVAYVRPECAMCWQLSETIEVTSWFLKPLLLWVEHEQWCPLLTHVGCFDGISPFGRFNFFQFRRVFVTAFTYLTFVTSCKSGNFVLVNWTFRYLEGKKRMEKKKKKDDRTRQESKKGRSCLNKRLNFIASCYICFTLKKKSR